MEAINIRGIPVHFPLNPYPCQISYMERVILALEKVRRVNNIGYYTYFASPHRILGIFVFLHFAGKKCYIRVPYWHGKDVVFIVCHFSLEGTPKKE